MVVVGAGPTGLLTSLQLQNRGARVVILHMEPIDGGIAGDHAAGLVEPVAMGSDPRIRRWLKTQLRFLRFLARIEGNPFGVLPTSVLLYSDVPIDDEWLIAMPNLRDAVSPHPVYQHAVEFDTYVIKTKRMLISLADSVSRGGGTFRHEEVRSIEDVAGRYHPDLVVVAAGLGNANLVPQANVEAGWGITLRTRVSKWQNRTWFFNGTEGMVYAIRRGHEIVLGGTNVHLPASDPGTAETGVEWSSDLLMRLDRDLPPGMFRQIVAMSPRFPEQRMAARPVGPRVQIDFYDHAGTPCLVVGTLGGSGFTLTYGAARDATTLVDGRTLGTPEAYEVLPHTADDETAI